MSPQLPKGKKGMKRKLRETKALTAAAIKSAMLAASQSLDSQAQEIIALKRILISERAQVIYYTSKYEAFVDHACVDITAVGFLSLPEEQQTAYIKRAIQELSDNQGIVPHDKDAQASQQEMESTGKKIILN
jgi:hypothetical protein